MPGQRYAVVSCHVEAILDDRVWAAFSAFQRRAPGGFRIAPLVRPPDERAGEDDREAIWLERAREAARHGPLGHHTHFVGPTGARPAAAGPEHGERVRREGTWLRERGLEPRFFCGGGWYIDGDVAAAVADLGYADCTATAVRPGYLAPGAPRLALAEPAWLTLGATRLLELPTTHSLGAVARRVLDPRPLAGHVHVYFHDTDLIDPRRRAALAAALRLLGRRRAPLDLDRLAELAAQAPERAFSLAA